MSAFQYVLRYLARRRIRTTLTFAGVSLAISAIVFAYGLSGWVEAYSSRSLSQVIKDSKIWVVPGGGVRLDERTGLLIPQGAISDQTIELLGSEITFRRVVAG